MNTRKKEDCVCLSYLDLFMCLSPFKALISAGLSFRLFFLPNALFPLAFKDSMFSLLVCLDLWPGWGAQRCSRIRSQKAIIDICIEVSVSLHLNAFLGVFSGSSVIEVIFLYAQQV